ADEKHSRCRTAKVYLPTLVTGRVIWPLDSTTEASAAAFPASYGELQRVASQQEPSYRVRGVLTDGFDSTTKSLRTQGSGHFRAKIYSKPETPVMWQHTAKKQSVSHTELHAPWSIKALKIDLPRVPRPWRGLSWLPFTRVGWLMEAKRQPISVPRLCFSSPGSPSFGLIWPTPESATCGKVSPISWQSVEKPYATP